MNHRLRWLLAVLLAAIAGCATPAGTQQAARPTVLDLKDAARDRRIPVALYFPDRRHACTPSRQCPVAFISPGYGLAATDYRFLADALTDAGYLVVAVQHDLTGDSPLARSGDLAAGRKPAWVRGAQNIRFVRDDLAPTHPAFDWSSVVLIGHSNGGDISALAVQQWPGLAKALITLDHRRHPLPQGGPARVLSIRGSDFDADPGVLPVTAQDERMCIVRITGSRHNDMNDHGPDELQSRIGTLVMRFLEHRRCDS